MGKNIKLSVVLATRNEEGNIARCLDSVKAIADEIVIFDEYSSDRTRDIARGFGARVFRVKHEPVFHITKQKAIEEAKGGWILQLDADEVVTEKLAGEIREVIEFSNKDIIKSQYSRASRFPKLHRLFIRHQSLISEREGVLGKDTGQIVAFFIPRANMFLGKPLKYGGVYPDGVIRLIKKGKARLPGKSVHELMEVDGELGWLYGDLLHFDSPTLKRYFSRLGRYTDLHATSLKDKKAPKNIFYGYYYIAIKPIFVFLSMYIRHKGLLDGWRGFLWSMFSSWHYPVAYWKYWKL